MRAVLERRTRRRRLVGRRGASGRSISTASSTSTTAPIPRRRSPPSKRGEIHTSYETAAELRRDLRRARPHEVRGADREHALRADEREQPALRRPARCATRCSSPSTTPRVLDLGYQGLGIVAENHHVGADASRVRRAAADRARSRAGDGAADRGRPGRLRVRADLARRRLQPQHLRRGRGPDARRRA